MSVDYVRTPGTETWEATTGATAWVHVLDPRTQNYTKTRVGGSQGSKRLRISIDDRRYNEEQVPEENVGLNVFRNGMLKLIRTDGAPEGYETDVDPTYHKSADELREYFEVRDGAIFAESMAEIQSELVLRRLKDLAEKDGTMEQLDILRDLIEARYANHKSQRVVEQMEADGEDGSVRLS